MPHEKGIMFIDRPPVISYDATGVTLTACSGPHSYTVRYDRSTWAKLMEVEPRRYRDFQLAERMDRGRVLPFKECG